MEKQKTCSFFLQNACKRATCPFLHVQPTRHQQPCRRFREGNCTFGDKCLFLHEGLPPVKICAFYKQGRCKSTKCKFSHEKDSPVASSTSSSSRSSKSPSQTPSNSNTSIAASVSRTSTPVSTSSSTRSRQPERALALKMYQAAINPVDWNIPFCQNKLAYGMCAPSCPFRHVLSPTEIAAASAVSASTVTSPPPLLSETYTGTPPGGVCSFYQRGNCRNGSACKYQHILLNEQDTPSAQATGPPCKFFATGECVSGEACFYSHDPQVYDTLPTEFEQSFVEQQPSSHWDSSIVPEPSAHRSSDPVDSYSAPPCRHFSAGRCRWGDSCKWSHSAPYDNDFNPTKVEETAEPDLPQPPTEDSQQDYQQHASWDNPPDYSGWDTPGGGWGDESTPYDPPKAPGASKGTKDKTSLKKKKDSKSDKLAHSKSDTASQASSATAKVGKGSAEPAPATKPAVVSEEIATPNDDLYDPWAENLLESVDAEDTVGVEGATVEPEEEGEEGEADEEEEEVEEATGAETTQREQASADSAGGWDDWGKPSDVPMCRNIDRMGYCSVSESCPFYHPQHSPEDAAAMARVVEHVTTDESEPSVKITVEDVLFQCNVEFGSTLVPNYINTPFDTSVIELRGLPPTISEEAIETLCTSHGPISDMGLEFQMDSASARITFDSARDAGSAAYHLNGITFEKSKLGASVATSYDAQHTSSTSPSTLKAFFTVATRTAWVYYETVGQAKNAVANLDKSFFQDRKIAASFPKKQKKGYSVIQLENLCADATEKELQDWCRSSGGANYATISVTLPTFDVQQASSMIDKALKGYGSFEPFEIAEYNKIKKKACGYARLRKMGASFDGVLPKEIEVPGLQDGKLKLDDFKPFHSTYFRVVAPAMQVVSALLLELALEHKSCHVKWYPTPGEGEEMRVRIAAEDPLLLAKFHRDVEPLVHGIPVTDEDGKIAWDDWLESEKVQTQIISALNAKSDVYGFSLCEFRHCQVRVFGTQKQREKTTKFIGSQLAKVKEKHTHRVPLTADQLSALCRGALWDLRNNPNIKNAAGRFSLDFAAPCLIIRGTTEEVAEANKVISKHAATESAELDPEHCVGCRRDVTKLWDLQCGHSFCGDCLTLVLQSVSRPDFSPPRCFAPTASRDTCGAHIPLTVAISLFNEQELSNLLEYSFLAYVRSHPTQVKLCPSTHCQMVYRPGTGEGGKLRCPSCMVWICTRCHTESHEGASCLQWNSTMVVSH